MGGDAVAVEPSSWAGNPCSSERRESRSHYAVAQQVKCGEIPVPVAEYWNVRAALAHRIKSVAPQ